MLTYKYENGKRYTLEELINLIVELSCTIDCCVDLRTRDGAGLVECYSDANGRGEFVLSYQYPNKEEYWRTTDIGRESIERQYDNLKNSAMFVDDWVFDTPKTILYALGREFRCMKKAREFVSRLTGKSPSMEDYVNIFWEILEPSLSIRKYTISEGNENEDDKLWHVHCVSSYSGDTWVRARTYDEAYHKARGIDIPCDEWIDSSYDIEEETDSIPEDMIQS